MKPALVLFAHGARDPEWAAPFRNIQKCIRARCPELAVELAFLELMSPALDEVLEQLAAAGHAKVTIAPLFMGQGGHLKRDLPREIDRLRARYPQLVLDALPAIGEVDPVLQAISDWLCSVIEPVQSS